jgi:hypothetical protein
MIDWVDFWGAGQLGQMISFTLFLTLENTKQAQPFLTRMSNAFRTETKSHFIVVLVTIHAAISSITSFGTWFGFWYSAPEDGPVPGMKR